MPLEGYRAHSTVQATQDFLQQPTLRETQDSLDRLALLPDKEEKKEDKNFGEDLSPEARPAEEHRSDSFSSREGGGGEMGEAGQVRNIELLPEIFKLNLLKGTVGNGTITELLTYRNY